MSDIHRILDEIQCTSDLGWREDDVYPHHKLR